MKVVSCKSIGMDTNIESDVKILNLKDRKNKTNMCIKEVLN